MTVIGALICRLIKAGNVQTARLEARGAKLNNVDRLYIGRALQQWGLDPNI